MGKEAPKKPVRNDELKEYLDGITQRFANPATGVDEPWGLVENLTQMLLKQHMKLTGRKPRLLHLPKAFEAAIQIAQGRVDGNHEAKVGKLRDRDAQEVFGVAVIWDAKEFKVE